MVDILLKFAINRAVVIYMAMLFVLLYLPTISIAQQDMEDVVYLKNGSIIRGIIIEQVPNVSIKVQTRDGSVFVYEMENILKITKEPRTGVAPLGSKAPVSSSLGKSAFLFNPLGFLQFGPILEGEFSLTPDTFFTAHFRYSALGFVYQALESDGFSDGISFTSAALGAGIRKFLENPYSSNRFYLSGAAEYSWGGTSGDVGTNDEWKGKDAQIIFLGNFGHRWRYPSKFFLNLGLIAGFGTDIKDDWWYIREPDHIYKESGAVFAAMLELSFGWEK